MTNYINIDNADIDRPIFRIVPVHRLFEIILGKRFVLVHPKKWEDPFEQNLSLSLVSSRYPIMGDDQESDQKVNAFWEKARRIRDCVGQCWSIRQSETDAMWRIYAPNKDGVKMQSTPRRLLETLQQHTPSTSHQCYIGKVLYKTKTAIEKAVEKIDFKSPRGVATSLLYKRKEFSHEREIRLLFMGTSDETFSFNVDTNLLIDKLVFDPRMPKELYEAYRIALTGLKYKNNIRKSLLCQASKELWNIKI